MKTYNIVYFEDGKYTGTTYQNDFEKACEEAEFMINQQNIRNEKYRTDYKKVISIELDGVVKKIFKTNIK